MFDKLTRLFKSKSSRRNPDIQNLNHFVQSDILNLYQWHLEQVSHFLSEQRWHDATLTQDVLKIPPPRDHACCDAENCRDFHTKSHSAERTSSLNKRSQGNQSRTQPVSHDPISSSSDPPPAVHDVHQERNQQKQEIRIPIDSGSGAPQGLTAESRISTNPKPWCPPPSSPLEASVGEGITCQAICQGCSFVNTLREVGLLSLAGIDAEIKSKWNMCGQVHSCILPEYVAALETRAQAMKQVQLHLAGEYICPGPGAGHFSKIKGLENSLIHMLREEARYRDVDKFLRLRHQELCNSQPLPPAPRMGGEELPSPVTPDFAPGYPRIFPDQPLTSSPAVYCSKLRETLTELQTQTPNGPQAQTQTLQDSITQTSQRIQESNQRGQLPSDGTNCTSSDTNKFNPDASSSKSRAVVEDALHETNMSSNALYNSFKQWRPLRHGTSTWALKSLII